jgi:hypothetical protein
MVRSSSSSLTFLLCVKTFFIQAFEMGNSAIRPFEGRIQKMPNVIEASKLLCALGEYDAGEVLLLRSLGCDLSDSEGTPPDHDRIELLMAEICANTFSSHLIIASALLQLAECSDGKRLT